MDDLITFSNNINASKLERAMNSIFFIKITNFIHKIISNITFIRHTSILKHINNDGIHGQMKPSYIIPKNLKKIAFSLGLKKKKNYLTIDRASTYV